MIFAAGFGDAGSGTVWPGGPGHGMVRRGNAMQGEVGGLDDYAVGSCEAGLG